MRITPDLDKVVAATQDLHEQGFKKPLLQTPQQFIFDCVLSYQAAMEMWLPFSELHRLVHDRVYVWFGFGAYCGWQGPLRLPSSMPKELSVCFCSSTLVVATVN